MIETIGWIGSICFALCGAPQAWLSYKQGHSVGVTWSLLILWLIGEICSIIYVVPKGHIPLIVNYLANLVFVAIVLYYKIKPRDGVLK